MPSTIYLLFSSRLNKFYIGCTEDLIEERLRRHISNHTGFTARAKDWKIVYTEVYSEKSAALKREKEIKGWKSSQRIHNLINKPE